VAKRGHDKWHLLILSLLHDLYYEGTEGFMVGKGILDGGYVNDEGKVIIGISIMECIGYKGFIASVSAS